MTTLSVFLAILSVIGNIPIWAQMDTLGHTGDQTLTTTKAMPPTPQEAEVTYAILREAAAFVGSFTNQLPAKGSGSSLKITPWPVTFTVNYPAEIRAEVTVKDSTLPRPRYILHKTSSTSPWVITERWLVSSEGKPLKALEIPDAEEQRIANMHLSAAAANMQKEAVIRAQVRFELVFARMRPLIDSVFTKESFAAEMADAMKQCEDQELFLSQHEAAAAAWERFTGNGRLSSKQLYIITAILLEGQDKQYAKQLCEQVNPQNKDCLSPSQVDELYGFATEEFAKRGMRRQLDPWTGKVIWYWRH